MFKKGSKRNPYIPIGRIASLLAAGTLLLLALYPVIAGQAGSPSKSMRNGPVFLKDGDRADDGGDETNSTNDSAKETSEGRSLIFMVIMSLVCAACMVAAFIIGGKPAFMR